MAKLATKIHGKWRRPTKKGYKKADQKRAERWKTPITY